MADSKMVTVREREWSVEVPAILHADLTLEFAAGNKRPYDAEHDVVRDAKPWQVQEFDAMRDQSNDSGGECRASREEQHGRYLDCGPQAWDDR